MNQKNEETKFSVLCSLFNWIQRSKTSALKRSKFRKFLDNFCKPSDYFAAIRLVLPNLDRERGSYGLKESVLATCLIDALGMSRDSDDALRLINWRKGGARTGANAGNFALVAAEVLQRRQGLSSGGLTINELNELLDRLASSENRTEKTSILTTLVQKTNAQEMKWIVMIILKDLKLGISEKSIFHEFHPDAEDLFNVTCDLKLVCEKLRNRSQRHKRQDIEVGKAVRPQLAMRVGDATAAWKKFHGKEIVVECKFDGDRIQIHKNGGEVHYYSRNFLDHSEYGHAMSDIIIQNVQADRCILDGEMLVWDTSLKRFAEFGSNQEIAKAAKDGLDSDKQLCYVAFDILYVGDTSVIHESLKERQELLQKVVKPLTGRLEILVPNGGLNTRRSSGEPCWSLVVHTVDDVQRFFKETIANRDEGIVIKDLGSKWEPSDRSGKWLKLKPDYIRAGSDLDVLIIGGYYGSGRRGGEVAQFLVGLAERPVANTYPRRFVSFCRVGTGLTDEELDAVATKLKPYLRKYDYPKKAPPSFYEVTNHSKERPDVWVESPEKSIILSITSDIRTIRSEVFAAPYSLRFPRIDRIRYDKPWHECLDVQSFIELVDSGNGTTQKGTGTDYGGLQDDKKKHKRISKKEEKRNLSLVPSHLVQTDVSGVKEDSLIFSKMMFYFVNVPPTHSLDSLHKIVAENGGTFSMNLNNSVTHCVAAESKGIKYQAAKRQGDVIHLSWVLDCCSLKKLLPLQPKYYLSISDSSKKKLEEEIDEFSDPYFWDLDLADMKQLLSNVPRSEDAKRINYYKKKYCPMEKWSRFHGCCICFNSSIHSLKPDWEVMLGVTVRRLKIEVLMGGGRVSDNLADATHLVLLSIQGCDVGFETLSQSLTEAEKHFLHNKRLHVVGLQWLEDCLEKKQRLQEESYSLKPYGWEEFNIEECNHDMVLEEAPSDNVEIQKVPSASKKGRNRGNAAQENNGILRSPERGSKRKRGRPAGTNRGKSGATQTRRTRARIGRKPAKISFHESDESDSYDHTSFKEDVDIAEGTHEMVGDRSLDMQRNEAMKDSTSSQSGKAAEQEVVADIRFDGNSVKFPEIEMIEKHNSQDQDNKEKLEVNDDPVQAMLLGLIPSLGTKNAQTMKMSIESEKPPVDLIPSHGKKNVQTTSHTSAEDDKPPCDIVAEPTKKKKVSYKDLASQLLKDW
ncbi:PREDICTED: DNA ligase 4 [Fragaria vesca subsp. vesca]|uniref:DNA ligase 4 n=1 Tax=Fragaria vesca subsp. vesca TaxID=101020 RepID=UPI0002C30B9B|nr:PREDICTED: DNA ligase 4 [Fragaria vesca subsp. vesca]